MNENPIGEFIWRMLGSTIQAYCREFGVDYMKKMIRFLADSDEFWSVTRQIQKMDPMPMPWERGAHEFLKNLTEINPPPEETKKNVEN